MEEDTVVVEQGRVEGTALEVRMCCICIRFYNLVYPLTEQLGCLFCFLLQVVDRFLLMI